LTAMPENGAAASAVVLIADDDPDILSLVSLRLKKSGFGVVTAADGEEALRAVREHRPELAIVDVRMPKMDGLELIRRIRADDESSEMPRVRDANRAEGFEAGADEYVKKPFSPRQLVDLVRAKLPTAPSASRVSPS
jgi:DNA-binding response OmpR family regulator